MRKVKVVKYHYLSYKRNIRFDFNSKILHALYVTKLPPSICIFKADPVQIVNINCIVSIQYDVNYFCFEILLFLILMYIEQLTDYI